jgi:penicillin amidase
VDGSKTATGYPLLANDIHLGISIPSIWYTAHLHAGELNMIGATIPGLPVFASGRNASIAWEVTNFHADVQDLYEERLSDDQTMAVVPGGHEPLRIVEETIAVKGAAPIHWKTRLTRHGPLISDAINRTRQEVPEERRSGHLEPLSLRWTALDAGDTSIQALLQMNRATSWEEFTTALALHVAPTQQFIYAGRDGSIGSHACGRVPIRNQGDGAMPVPGWVDTFEWLGSVPFADLPHTYNPNGHVVVYANEDPADGGQHHLGYEWAAPYRSERIHQMLNSLTPVDISAMQHIQGDLHSSLAKKFLALALPHVDNVPAQVIGLLERWDGQMTVNSPAAAIYASWLRAFLVSLAASHTLPQALRESYEAQVHALTTYGLDRLRALGNGPDDQEQALTHTLIQESLLGAIDSLGRRFGGDPDAWRWGDLHQALFIHQPLGQVKLLKRWANRRAAMGGDWSTVNIGAFKLDGSFNQELITDYRQIIDLSDADASLFIYPSGQSGHILSRDYAGYIDDWRELRYRRLRFSEAAIECVKCKKFDNL